MTAPPADRATERLRLFVALAVPEAARREVAAWARRSLGGISDLRILDPELLHVTLAFLGWREASAVEQIAELLQEPLAGGGPPRLVPSATAALPRRHPRVVALDLTDHGERAAQVQREVAERLARAGLYEPELRPFRPHLTVARVPKRGVAMPALLPDPPATGFDSSAVVLYRSDLGPSGARYTALAQAPLR
jgi:2'-5' RNA ligase